MSGSEMVPSLMFGTFGIVLVVAVGALVWFLRKRSNRDAYKRVTGIDEDAGKHDGSRP